VELGASGDLVAVVLGARGQWVGCKNEGLVEATVSMYSLARVDLGAMVHSGALRPLRSD
jgi:hypothetical protein